MKREEGFTLIEMVIAIVVLVLVLAVSVPSLTGVLADRRLRRSLDAVNAMVRQAQELSISERRSYLIVVVENQLALRAEAVERGEDRKPISVVKCQKGESLSLSFPAALAEEPPQAWVFWPSGNCEPAVVEYRGKDGRWKANYSALTARGELTSYVSK